MKLTSPTGRQYLAICTDTLWVQCRIDPNHPLSAVERIVALEQAIDATKLQREGPVTIRPLSEDLLELRLRVAYGPVYGGCRQDLERSAESIERRLEDVAHFNCVMANTCLPSNDCVKAIAGIDMRDDFDRRSLTLADLKTEIDRLTARSKDASLTDMARGNAARRLEQCRIYLAHVEPVSLIDGCSPQPVESNRFEDARKPCTSPPAPVQLIRHEITRCISTT
jgi:hypothetical protein